MSADCMLWVITQMLACPSLNRINFTPEACCSCDDEECSECHCERSA